MQMRYEKIAIFDYLTLSRNLDTRPDQSCYETPVGTRTYTIYRMVPFLVTTSDPIT